MQKDGGYFREGSSNMYVYLVESKKCAFEPANPEEVGVTSDYHKPSSKIDFIYQMHTLLSFSLSFL